MAVCLLAGMTVAGGTGQASPATAGGKGYEDLAAFFRDWRAFQKPKLVDGVPDYTPAAMAEQQRELEAYRQRLAAIDPSGWPIPQQVDYYIVRAELCRPRLRSPRLEALGQQPGLLRHGLLGRERSAGARGAVRPWLGRAVVLPVPAVRGERREDRRGDPADPAPPRAGEVEPDRQWQGPLDLRREGDQAAERGPEAARLASSTARRRISRPTSSARRRRPTSSRPGSTPRRPRRPAPRASASRTTTGT